MIRAEDAPQFHLVREVLREISTDPYLEDTVLEHVKYAHSNMEEGHYLFHVRNVSFTGATVNQRKKFDEVAKRLNLTYEWEEQKREYTGMFKTLASSHPVAFVTARKKRNRFHRYELPKLKIKHAVGGTDRILLNIIMAMTDDFYEWVKQPERSSQKPYV